MSKRGVLARVGSAAVVAALGSLLLEGTQPAAAATCSMPPSRESAADLDRLFARHKMVFLARVEKVNTPGVLADAEVRPSAELFVYKPPLKGTAPGLLTFDLGEPCSADFSEGAVYLIFANDPQQTPAAASVRPVLAYESGPGNQWIVDWIQDKHSTEPTLVDLRALRWQHRVLVVNAGDTASDVFSALKLRADDIAERDLVWVLVSAGGVQSNFPGRLAPEFVEGLQNDRAQSDYPVILIGKDGEVKLQGRYLDLDRVFSRIDSMPMRLQEQ